MQLLSGVREIKNEDSEDLNNDEKMKFQAFQANIEKGESKNETEEHCCQQYGKYWTAWLIRE